MAQEMSQIELQLDRLIFEVELVAVVIIDRVVEDDEPLDARSVL